MTFGKILLAAAAGFVYTLWNGRTLSVRKRNSALARGKKFVVIGGGFAGVEAARELAHQLSGHDDSAQVILVDKRDYLLFTPMLTEAVGARVQPHHIIVPLSSFSKRVRLIKGTVKDINLAFRTVTFEEDELAPLEADHIVIALGANSNFHHIPGVESAAYSLKTLDDAQAIRQGAIEMLKLASNEVDTYIRQSMLTFVVAGGGYTGVEGIAALNELLREKVLNYPTLDQQDVRTILVEPLDRLMTEVTPDLASYSQKQLEKAGVQVILKTAIKGVSGDQIELSTGERIHSKTLIWTAGVRANPLVSQLGAPTGKGKAVKVDGCLSVPNVSGVWAVGDCAEIPDSNGQTYAQTAQNATREGRLVARNIFRALRGDPLKTFRYKPIGELALVGHRKGVARIYGINFSGFIAYALWRAIYIAKMPSISQRLRVLSDWMLDVTLGSVAEYNANALPTRHRELIEARR